MARLRSGREAPPHGRTRSGAATQEGPFPGAHTDREPCDRHDRLGQGMVRQPGELPRLRKPVAEGPDVCAQRLGHRPAGRAGRGQGSGQRVVNLSGRGCGRACAGCPVAVAPRRLRGPGRVLGGAAAGPPVQGRHGAHVPPRRRAVPQAIGDTLRLHLRGSCVDVQARGGRAVRRGGAARREPGTAVPAAGRRGRRSRGGPRRGDAGAGAGAGRGPGDRGRGRGRPVRPRPGRTGCRERRRTRSRRPASGRRGGGP